MMTADSLHQNYEHCQMSEVYLILHDFSGVGSPFIFRCLIAGH